MRSRGEVDVAGLPYVDEHAIELAATAGETWEALLDTVERSTAGANATRFARLLGCEDSAAAGPRPLAVGSAVPGFHIAAAIPPAAEDPAAPAELALAGAHRFSRFALIFRLEPAAEGRTRLRAETRAEFPGAKGALYRVLVIGTRFHVLATRRILGAVERRAGRGYRA